MEKEKRTKQLIELLNNDTKKIKLLQPLIDDIVQYETQLELVQKLPLLTYNPRHPEQQRLTPAAKLITSLTAQYTAALKTFHALAGDIADESPLRAYYKKLHGGPNDNQNK